MANGELRVWHGSKWIRPDKRLAIYMRDGWRCVYCKKNLRSVKPKYRTLDHVTPVARGGSNAETNLVTACKACNDAKKDTTVGAFCVARRLDFIKVQTRVDVQRAQPLDRKLAKQILAGTFDAASIQ